MLFEKASFDDLEKISRLYDDVCDELDVRTNYPGWKKGVYPTRDDALDGWREGVLYVMRDGGRISICRNCQPWIRGVRIAMVRSL